jgi:DNA-directed RNA polymerase specialized sigma24 family protein
MGIVMKIKYTARWNRAFEGRAINLAKQFYPRLCVDYEIDDLVQEAYIVFLKCKRKYEGTVDNPKWFMSLYNRALTNKLITLSAKTAQYSFIASTDTLPEVATKYDESFLRVVLQELPDEVKDLFKAVCEGTMADGRMALAGIRQKFPNKFD